ncbi:PREDICTED: uncharacterized protein LOC106784131 [Polistes canadensis]|uniref:uncharacterized protein LOC106784131 n=1 Tax=Polistes canadensis TaxID=91411 RepID=UPI000718E605|nr:PREDICTED: uncharacterized protein LOC106784131 [Polistes canadensis]
MEGVQIVQLLLPYTNYLLSIIAIIYMMIRRGNQSVEIDINTAQEKNTSFDINTSLDKNTSLDQNTSLDKNTTLENEEDSQKFRKLVKFATVQKPEYYFTDDFYNLFSTINQFTSNDIEQFGEYVSLELDCLQFQSSKEKLKREIRKTIVQISNEDRESYLSDTSANISTLNHVVK